MTGRTNGRGWSLLIVGNRKTVVGRREVFEPGYNRRGLWRSCVVFNRSEANVQPSYDGRRWSYVITDIFWCTGLCIGHRIAAWPSYGRRTVGDFLEDCPKQPAMVGYQLRLVSEQSPIYDMSLREVADQFPILHVYKFRGFAGLESFYDYFLVFQQMSTP